MRSTDANTRPDRGPRPVVPALLVVFAFLVGVLVVAPLPHTSLSPTFRVSPELLRSPATDFVSTGSAPLVSAPSVPVPLAGASDWLNVSRSGTGHAPPPGYSESVAYDPAGNVTVLFGGCLATACPANQTWVFSNGSWANVTDPHRAPPARQSASMDYDPNMGGVLLFGGAAAGNTPLNDTWLYRSGIWTNVTYVGTAPSARYGASMAFDPEVEENGSVLFGGCVPGSFGVSCTNDTWVWSGWSGWIQLGPSVAPPSVGFAAMAFDPSDGAIVFFGGCAGFLCLGLNNQTWEFYSGQWWEQSRGTFPAPRSGASMAYNPAGQQLLMFGGVNASGVLLADTLSFAHEGWQLLSPAHSPAARSSYGLSWDPTGNTVLLVGGIGATADLNDTWVYEQAPMLTLTASATTSETSQPITFTASVVGGTPAFSVSFTLGDGSYSFAVGPGPTVSVTHPFGFAGNYSATANLTDSVGVVARATATAVRVTLGPEITAFAHPSLTDVDLPVTFLANTTSPGFPPLTYQWGFGDNASGIGQSVTHAYFAPGTYMVSVRATDLLGGTATYSLSVVVSVLPTVTISSVPAAPDTSSEVTLHASVAGGTASYSYSWRFSDGGTSVVPSPSHRFAQAGTYSVQVWVNDSVGGTAHTSSTLVVSTPPGTSTNGGTAAVPLWFWGAVAALAVVAVVGILLLLRRRH